MEFLDQLAEQRIREAQSRGELERLPGSGQALNLDDDSMVPPELRMAYRVLKNAGMVPPEVENLRQLRELLAGLGQTEPELAQYQRGRQRLAMLLLRLENAGLGRSSRAILAEYEEKLVRHLTP